MGNRLLSMLLCISILIPAESTAFFTNLSFNTSAQTQTEQIVTPAIFLELDGEAVSDFALEQYDKKTLSARVEGIDNPSYQWQILMDAEKNIWANILDKKEQTCEVSYSLLLEMLDEADSAYIRCAVYSDDSIRYYSSPVSITVFKSPDEFTTDSPASSEPVLSEPLSEGISLFSRRSGIVSPLAESDSEYVSITIKYLDYKSYTNGVESAIYSSYIATIDRGSGFNQTVVSPTYLGFAPYYDADGDGQINDNASALVLNYASVAEDIEICVYYKPINVNFSIRYFFQNINDDLYTEDAARFHTGQAETGTIISDEELRLHAGDTTGFSKMYHIPEAVAADGSTVFECYYDRNYYLVNFNNNSGYGVDPIYARYQTPFLVNDPIRHGFVFGGWDLISIDTNGDGIADSGDGVADTLPDVIPANQLEYIALWDETDTSYTVAYWAEDHDGEIYFLGSKVVEGIESSSVVSGSDDLGDDYICGFTEHEHSASCLACGHIHTRTACLPYGYSTGTPNNQTDLPLYQLMDPTPESGYIYVTRTGTSGNTRWYYLYLDGSWYYLGSYNGINSNWVSGDILKTSSAVFSGYGSYYGEKYSAKLRCNHVHDSTCVISCGKEEHAHNADCSFSGGHLEFTHADQNITVAGDGSTVVNVYYAHKDYTLRFYYARSKEETNGTTTYQVVGGTTYPFGTNVNTTNQNTPLYTLFSNVTQWGKVAELPTINSAYADRYTLGTYYNDNTNGYTYHYLQFTVPYGEYLKDLWPIGIFNAVEIAESHNTSINGAAHGVGNQTGVNDLCIYGNYAYFSAWNGEYKVKYTQDNASARGGNETIKGCYMYLDEQVIYADEFEHLEEEIIVNGNKSSVVNFLGFWDNGARVGWSVPKKFVYHLRIESSDPSAYAPKDEGISTNYNGTYSTITNLSSLDFNVINYQNFDTFDDSNPGAQTIPPVTGYTYVGRYVVEGTEVINGYNMPVYHMYYYYSTDSTMELSFYNYNKTEKTVTPISFGTSLAEYATFIPSYPEVLEENAYSFAGWYTNAQCLGDPFDFENETMPATDLTLYAKWIPKKHTVNFFKTFDQMNAYQNGESTEVFYVATGVTHGTLITGAVPTPTNVSDSGAELIFSGWFYLENGQKKAFTPLNMPINGDMNIFADWSSFSPQPYRITYYLENNKTTKVADDTFGMAYAGSTRTFVAKAGAPFNQLYDEYNEGYFPTVSSHSILIEYEADSSQPTENVYSFYYVKANDIEYTVNYINKETNVVMHTETKTTSAAVVTERFVPYPDMVPDAFYKRLVLSVEKDENGNYVGTDENVINFYYTPNTRSAYYAVHYMLEKQHDPYMTPAEIEALRNNYAIDGSGGYESTGTHIEGVADVGETVHITPQEFVGFEVLTNQAKVVHGVDDTTPDSVLFTDGTFDFEITEEGSELYIFCKRNSYKYNVYYYEYNTTNAVPGTPAGVITGGTAYYEDIIEITAPTISGYTCVSSDMDSALSGVQRSMQIRHYDNEGENQNNLIFYYAPTQYTVEYVAVPADGGVLSRTIEVRAGAEAIQGSKVQASQYYDFVGWFKDEDCTIGVTAADGTLSGDGTEFIPYKDKLSATQRNIFYAKFTPRAGDLTIRTTNAADDNQVFVFEVKNNASNEVITVTVVGNSSVTISNMLLGEYTITQLDSWSWRYSAAIGTINHSAPTGTIVNVGEQLTNKQWLNANSEQYKNTYEAGH